MLTTPGQWEGLFFLACAVLITGGWQVARWLIEVPEQPSGLNLSRRWPTVSAAAGARRANAPAPGQPVSSLVKIAADSEFPQVAPLASMDGPDDFDWHAAVTLLACNDAIGEAERVLARAGELVGCG